MSPIDISVVAVGSVVTLWVLVRLYRKRGMATARVERFAPDDPQNFVLLEETEGEEDMAVETMAARFGDPLWVFGLCNADAWLLNPASGLPLLVLDISDPHAEGNPNRDPLMDSAAFLITEHVRVHTDAKAVAAVSVHTETGKLVIPTGDADQTRRLAEELGEQQEEVCVLLWGVATGGDSLDVSFEVWFPDEPYVEPHTCSMYDLPEKVARIMTDRTPAKPADPPWWYKDIELTDLADYAVLLDGLQLQILAAPKNQAIHPLDADAHLKFVTLALEFLTQDRLAVTQFVLAALGACLYAARAGCLMDEHRKRALEILRSFEDRDHPVYRLSPLYLDAFGEAEEAVMRRDVLLAGAGGAYAEWLQALELSLLGGEG